MNKNSASVSRTQKRKKDFAIRSFGGKCQKCGYDKCQGALEFHHINGEKKEHNPSSIIQKWAWSRVKTELQKCVLLCANCHREAHYVMNNNDALLLKRLMVPFMTIKCERCGKQFDTKLVDARFCSRTCHYLANRRVVRPDKKILSSLIESETTWLQIGKMFGVSNTAAKKWAVSYGIAIPKRRSIHPKPYNLICKNCNGNFKTPDKDGQYCSRTCSSEARRKERPTRDQLLADLAVMSISKISIKYGVSRKTVRVWTESFGI